MSFIIKFIQLYSSAETVKKATVIFYTHDILIGAILSFNKGASIDCGIQRLKYGIDNDKKLFYHYISISFHWGRLKYEPIVSASIAYLPSN